MSTWSGIRNKLESDYLCPALRGHIQYFATSYSKSADHEGRAAIRVDGVEVLRSNYYTYFALLDRRLGKRRLLALEESMEQELDWVRAFYVTRMQAEGLMDRE